MLLLPYHFLLLMVATVGAAVIPEKIGESNAPDSELNFTSPSAMVLSASKDFIISKDVINGFPPGYPESQYRYDVPHSTITLVCIFRYEPKIQPYQVDAVLQRSIIHYGDPGKQDDSVYKGVARAWDVHSGHPNEGVTYLTIRVNPSERYRMTYGQASHALIGVNRIRTEWPRLDISCLIHHIFQDRDIDLGDIEIFHKPAANLYQVSTE